MRFSIAVSGVAQLSLGGHLIVDANKGGRFVKTAPGTFDVREINPRGAEKRPKPRTRK